MADVSQLFSGLKSMSDYQRAEEEFQMKKQLVQAELQNAKMGGKLPSNIQEWNAYQQMPPDQREEYLRMKRADQIMNLGGTMGVRNPLGGGLIEQYEVTPEPEQMPGFRRQVAEQEAAGKLGQELEFAPMIEQEKTVARLAGEAEGSSAKKSKQAGEAIGILKEAESLLGNAPGGLIESGITAGKRALNKSDVSTQADEQLKLLSGWLVANVPRMEGPQSNFDVQNYKTMAADLGNTLKPVGDRLAALQGLRALQEKYTGQSNIPEMDAIGAASGNMPGMAPKGDVGEIEFKLQKAGFTPAQIKEYKSARGIQ